MNRLTDEKHGHAFSHNLRPRHIVLVLLDRFGIIPFSCLVDCMRTANRYSNQAVYTWDVVSLEGDSVESSCQVRIATESTLQQVRDCDRLFLISTSEAKNFHNQTTVTKLNQIASKGVMLCSVSSATFVLANAGLLNGYRCTIHWEDIPIFRKLYPTLNCTQNIYEIDGNRATCSGGTAALDMMLELVEADCGHGLSRAISQVYQHDRLRTAKDLQQMESTHHLIVQSPKLVEAIELMRNNIEDPLSSNEIAGYIGVSQRQLERLFKKYRGITPQRYYLNQRLENARQLLLHTSRSGFEVALSSGFTSHSHFIKTYRDFYGKTPQEERVIETKQAAGYYFS